MDSWKKAGILVFWAVIAGCAKPEMVVFEDVERTNSVIVELTSGGKITGTVLNAEPHRLVILLPDRTTVAVPKTSIRTLNRKQPVMDDFGRGISEEEIQSVRTKKNTFIYGIGGGLLSFGASFFVGSLAGQNSGEVLAATTLGGGTIGTLLFIRAGRAMDRKQAIQNISERRRVEELKDGKDADDSSKDFLTRLEEEKRRQEELRKTRETLLRDMEARKKKKSGEER